MSNYFEVSVIEQISLAGKEESDKILSDAKKRDWGRPGLGTLIIPLFGTIAGLFAHGPEYMHKLRESKMVKAKAELDKARDLFRSGNQELTPEICAEYAEKHQVAKYTNDRLPLDNQLINNTGIGFILTLIVPLPLNILAYAFTAWQKSDNVKQVHKEALNEGKKAADNELQARRNDLTQRLASNAASTSKAAYVDPAAEGQHVQQIPAQQTQIQR